MASGGVPPLVLTLASAAAVILGGMLTLSLSSSASIRALKAVTEAKRKKFTLRCSVRKGTGFYICKLCKGNSTIEWSPLYNPVFALLVRETGCNAVSTVWEKGITNN